MARQVHFFLTNEDPNQLNAYSPGQLRRLADARLIDANTVLTLYGSAVTRPLREWFHLRTWEFRPEVALTNRRPTSRLRLFASIAAGAVGLELVIATLLLGSLSAALRWNGDLLASTARKVGLFLYEKDRPKPEPSTSTLRYSGDTIVLEACQSTDGTPTSPAELQLKTAGQVGGRIFAGGSFHSKDRVISSVLLATDDGGRSWIEAAPRYRETELGAAQVSDLRVWIAAHRQTGDGPLDPFFLFTFDSGLHWRRIPLRPYSEAGRITSFHFREDGNGFALVREPGPVRSVAKRFVTADGANSWVLTEAEEPSIPGTQPNRIRIQESADEFRIQVRDEKTWTTVSRISWSAGVCPDRLP
jgi:hypothetical protein